MKRHGDASEMMSLRFARVAERVGLIGMVLLAVTGIAHLAGAPSLVPASLVVEHWHRPPAEFWAVCAAIETDGIGWITGNVLRLDMLNLLCIALLPLAPLAAVLAAIPTADRTYRFLLGALAVELVLAPCLAILL